MKKLLFFVSISAFADINSTVPPVRPTYQDVSLKVIQATFNQEPYKWYRGHTATQAERDGMEETLSSIAISEAVQLAKSIPACIQAAKSAVSRWNGVTSKLGIGYEDAALKANDIWTIPVFGRHYSFERYGLLDIQTCMLGSGKKLCASSPLLTKNLQDLLNIHVENGACVKGSDVQVYMPSEPFDVKRSMVDAVVTKKQASLTTEQMTLLHKTHEAHKAVSDWRCGVGVLPEPGAVDREHQAFEASATNITQQHFFAMKRFSGTVDSQWSKDQECKWARLQDKAHEDWMIAVMLGDWRQSRRSENVHQMMHQCMNLRDANYKVLLPCGQDNIFNCPKITCDQVLEKL